MKNKVKTFDEFDKHLLDKKSSKRDRTETKGTTLLPVPPTWAIKENQWGDEYKYERQIDGWEKLCIEAYFSGWVDFFDTVIYGQKIDHTIYFQWIEDIKRDSSLKIYLEPGVYKEAGPEPKPLPPPPPPSSFVSAVPKPPPPPIG